MLFRKNEKVLKTFSVVLTTFSDYYKNFMLKTTMTEPFI